MARPRLFQDATWFLVSLALFAVGAWLISMAYQAGFEAGFQLQLQRIR